MNMVKVCDGSRPILEIFIPTYNRVKYLRPCIESVLSQTYSDFRVIVLDNASEEDVASVVAAFNDERLSLISNKSNIGGPANILKAFDMASSEYVMVFHDDDFMHPQLLEAQLQILQTNENIVFVAPSVNMISDDSEMDKFYENADSSAHYKIFDSQTDFLDAHFSGHYLVGFGGVMYRTSATRKEKINIKRFGNIADRPFLVSLAALGKSVFLVFPNYNVRLHRGQDSLSASWGPCHEQEAAKFYLSISKKRKNNPYAISTARMLAQLYVVRKERPNVFKWLSELRRSELSHWSLVVYFLPVYTLRSIIVRLIRTLVPSLLIYHTKKRITRSNKLIVNSVGGDSVD